jgi:4-hydroxybenzoate polyprenyltransferase
MILSDRQRLFAWLQLLRLANVFTAVADVAMGYLVTHGALESPVQFSLLVAASCLLYLSGMVLNDVFDANVDKREQPSRPIPSGRVSLRAAAAVGWSMLASGVAVAWFASATTRDLRPGIVATLLAACIVLYDRFLKQTLIAPFIMGACRGLNVLLGMSLARLAAEDTSVWVEWNSRAALMIASGVGLYIIGVTIFSRTDAVASSRTQLTTGLVVLFSGMGTLALVPNITNNVPPLLVLHYGWYMLWILLAIITGRRCVAAILKPSPHNVQTAVRHCVHTIIVLDAAVCVGYAGPVWGFAVLSLIFPTILLTAWLRAT